MGTLFLNSNRRTTRHWDMLTSLKEEQIYITNIIQYTVTTLAHLITSNFIGQFTAQVSSK